MKKLNTKTLQWLTLASILALILSQNTLGVAQAKQTGQEAPSSPPQAALRLDLERVQLEEQLIRSDASTVMFGEWLSMRENGGAE
jgi:hypothetical protein